MTRRALVVGLCLAATAATVAGCSDSSAAAKLTIVGTEMAFVAPATVPAAEYEVTFRNDGGVFHELAFTNPAGQVVARRSIAAGDQVTLTVALAPGAWELGCFEPGHYEQGMRTPLLVEA
jgi:hypothetical protein